MQETPNTGDATALARMGGLLDEMTELLEELVDVDSEAGEGVAHAYAEVIVIRLAGTFDAMALLLKAGYLDEAVIILRRQLEDSMRLHYVSEHPERADALLTKFNLDKDQRVLRAMDKLLNDPEVPQPDKDIIKASSSDRRARVNSHLNMIRKQSLEVENLPSKFEDLASEVGRFRDIVAYASAADVSHSAISGVTNAYVERDGADLIVEKTSRSAHDALTYAKSAVTSTAISIASAFRIRGRDELADEIATRSIPIERELIRLRETLSS